MTKNDIDSIVEIDSRVLGQRRTDYYERKGALALDHERQLVTSMVAEYDGRIIGFTMGNLYMGEYGIPEATASLDTIGVHPDYQGKGVASELIRSYVTHMKKAGVEKVYIMVNWNDWGMLRLFEKFGFVPAKTLNLELNLT